MSTLLILPSHDGKVGSIPSSWKTRGLAFMYTQLNIIEQNDRSIAAAYQ